MRALRTASAAALITAAGLALSGCSLIGGDNPKDPVRDDEGAITEADDDSDPFALVVGDCLNVSELGTEITSVPTRPCAEEHEAEIYGQTLMPDGEFPGDEGANAQADDFCYGAFQAFVGAAYEDSSLDFNYLRPTVESWKAGDREILCFVFEADGTMSTGTLKGAAH